MTAYLFRMPAGIAGAVSRPQDLTIEPVLINTANPFSQYGLAGKFSGNFFVPLEEDDTADKIVGIFVRPLPTTSTPD
ncbi:phage cement protein, partial [Yersinia enterocolitica]